MLKVRNWPKEDEEQSFTIYPLTSIGDIATMLQNESVGLGYNLLTYPDDGNHYSEMYTEHNI